jgi:hypothetical protein
VYITKARTRARTIAAQNFDLATGAAVLSPLRPPVPSAALTGRHSCGCSAKEAEAEANQTQCLH